MVKRFTWLILAPLACSTTAPPQHASTDAARGGGPAVEWQPSTLAPLGAAGTGSYVGEPAEPRPPPPSPPATLKQALQDACDTESMRQGRYDVPGVRLGTCPDGSRFVWVSYELYHYDAAGKFTGREVLLDPSEDGTIGGCGNAVKIKPYECEKGNVGSCASKAQGNRRAQADPDGNGALMPEVIYRREIPTDGQRLKHSSNRWLGELMWAEDSLPATETNIGHGV